MKKVMILILVSFMSVAMASESIGTKSCAATKASQKREMGKKVIPASPVAEVTKVQPAVVHQE